MQKRFNPRYQREKLGLMQSNLPPYYNFTPKINF